MPRLHRWARRRRLIRSIGIAGCMLLAALLLVWAAHQLASDSDLVNGGAEPHSAPP